MAHFSTGWSYSFRVARNVNVEPGSYAFCVTAAVIRRFENECALKLYFAPCALRLAAAAWFLSPRAMSSRLYNAWSTSRIAYHLPA